MALFITTQKLLIALEKMDEVSEQVEESLDIIDQAYSNVSNHLESPVLFDDPVVVSMIRDVKNARESMLLIANKVVEPFAVDTDSNEEKTK
jgi:hypothetical protein